MVSNNHLMTPVYILLEQQTELSSAGSILKDLGSQSSSSVWVAGTLDLDPAPAASQSVSPWKVGVQGWAGTPVHTLSYEMQASQMISQALCQMPTL